MNPVNKINIRKFHESRIEKYGSGNAKSLAWHNEESQLKRFEVLSKIGNLSNKSILDAGCGNGDFCIYLTKYFSGFAYHGLDIVSEFLDNAAERTAHLPETHFYLADFMAVDLPQVDYVFACGSLHYKNTDPEFIYQAISRLYATCRYGFAFTLLSSTPNPDGILCMYEPDKIVAFCKTLSANVQLLDSYEDGEVGVYLKK